MPFIFEKLEIPDVVHVTPQSFTDDRGVFTEIFKASDFEAQGLPTSFPQINLSVNKKHVLRGLHYQKQPSGQGKLVRVIEGVVFDVAVDIRKGSPTFGKWVGMELSSAKKNMLYVPVGFAHGFCVVSDGAQVVYNCTSEYAPQAEAGIIWNDPTIAVAWPVSEPVLSLKDQELPSFEKADYNFTL